MKKLAQFFPNWRASVARQIAFLNGSHVRRAGDDDVIRVPPARIRFKLLGPTVRELRGESTPAEDWDLSRRPIGETAKYTSVVQHFREGVPWEDTPIFRRYAARLSRGEVIRGCRSVDELKEVYRVDMDRLYVSLKERGFLSHDLRKSELPHVYVGRDGEIIFGSNGNHRLAIATVLEFAEIPCRVIRRHADWENLRHGLAAVELKDRRRSVQPALEAHPDLRSLLP